MSARAQQTALVTGGSRGIGRSLARALSRRGFFVVVTGRDEGALDGVVRAGEAAHALVLDHADTAATVRAVRALDERLGGLDLVIANAGVGAPDPRATPYAWETLEAALHVNLCGAAATLTAALPAMVARGRGHLVGIGSLASFGPLPSAGAYCTPKAGLSMLLDCLRLDLAGTGVAVTTVNLGFVRTRMVAEAPHPMPQLLEPDEAAVKIVAALASRPRVVTLPWGLATLARGFALLPRFAKELIAVRVRGAGA